MPLITSEFSAGIGAIALRNPAKRNCLNGEMISGILSTLEEFAPWKGFNPSTRSDHLSSAENGRKGPWRGGFSPTPQAGEGNQRQRKLCPRSTATGWTG